MEKKRTARQRHGIESDWTATERMGDDSRGAVTAEFGEVLKSNGMAW